MTENQKRILKIHANLVEVGKQKKNKLSARDFSRFQQTSDGRLFILEQNGGRSMRDLLESFWKETGWDIKSTFREFHDIGAKIVVNALAGQKKSAVKKIALESLQKNIESEVSELCGDISYYEGCYLIPYETESFSIGPVKFSNTLEFEKSFPSDATPYALDEFIQRMKDSRILWVAQIEISDVLSEKGEELSAIAIDIALTSIQLMLPVGEAKGMRRFTALNFPHGVTKYFSFNGRVTLGSSNDTPGLSYTGAYFSQFLEERKELFNSYGQRIRALTDHSTSQLDLSWCDAAYWFHEGIVEPLDTVAVPKLETCLEILLYSESSRGSQKKILEALKFFFGKGEDDPINDDTNLTLKELAKDLVRDRSRVLHGTWSTLKHDMRFSRSVLTQISQILLTEFSLRLDDYKQSSEYTDDHNSFFDWMVNKSNAIRNSTQP